MSPPNLNQVIVNTRLVDKMLGVPPWFEGEIYDNEPTQPRTIDFEDEVSGLIA